MSLTYIVWYDVGVITRRNCEDTYMVAELRPIKADCAFKFEHFKPSELDSVIHRESSESSFATGGELFTQCTFNVLTFIGPRHSVNFRILSILFAHPYDTSRHKHTSSLLHELGNDGLRTLGHVYGSVGNLGQFREVEGAGVGIYRWGWRCVHT
jgi:hypothetical protein